MKRIGLTGGAGSGKSIVAQLFREQGFTVIDLDAIGREVIENGEQKIIEKIREICGPQCIVNHKVDRNAVRESIFSNIEKRKSLETFLHPLIWQEFEKRTQGKSKVICEAALLIETKAPFDTLIVVLAPENVRKERLIRRDGITADLAQKMIQSQASDTERAKVATFIVRNDSSIESLKPQVEKIASAL